MFPITDNGGSRIMLIPAGVHPITAPLSVDEDDLIIRGEEGAVLCAAVLLDDAVWRECGGGVYCTETDRVPDRLYINDIRYRMARYPKYDPHAQFLGGGSADCLSRERTAHWKNPAGGYVHAIHKHLWGGFSYRITGRDEEENLTLTGGWQNNRQMGMHDEYRFVENILEELTEPGEWCYREDEKRIYVMPYPGHDLRTAQIAVNHAFFRLENRRNVTIENLTFTKSARTFMDTREPLLRSDWTIYRGGAVYFHDCTDCRIDSCTFEDIGSNAVFVDGNCSGITVFGTRIQDIGASGVCFVGRSDSVRSPLFEYEQTHEIGEIDLTPGPKSDNYPKNCTVDNCLIAQVGTVEKQATGVEISMAYGITVSNSSIYDASRAGINISEGTFGGHRIIGCDVFDTVQETGDHGSFNSWGRDRFWHLRGATDAQMRELAALDMIAPTVIANNRFRCDHGWDIDLDDGSSCYEIYNNLCLSGGIKLREGFNRHVYNNITVNNTVHMHAWFEDSGDRVEHNILFAPYEPALMPTCRWGECIDGNYLHTTGQTETSPATALAEISGQDAHSVAVHCVFRDPETCDYTLESPQLPGFANFPMVFGVQYPPLCRLRREPDFPVWNGHEKAASSACIWQGMTVKNIDTDDEMSAYGTAGHDGVIVVNLNGRMEAQRLGLRAGDVILAVGNRDVHSTDDLADCDLTAAAVDVLRGQKRISLTADCTN